MQNAECRIQNYGVAFGNEYNYDTTIFDIVGDGATTSRFK